MLLDDHQIQTREVKQWQGLHLLHFEMSSCSQKVRMLMGELDIDYVSHPINLMKNEQRSEWYRGINPNAVVPVLVHDGDVHIESNDIIEYLNARYATTEQSFLPTTESEQSGMHELMDLEDKLHSDLRTVTFTYLAPDPGKHAPPSSGSSHFIDRFYDPLTLLNEKLEAHKYLIGNRVTLADISWYITLHRLHLAGYPLDEHPAIWRYFQRISKRPAFQKEASSGSLVLRVGSAIYRNLNRVFNRSLKKDFAAWQQAR